MNCYRTHLVEREGSSLCVNGEFTDLMVVALLWAKGVKWNPLVGVVEIIFGGWERGVAAFRKEIYATTKTRATGHCSGNLGTKLM